MARTILVGVDGSPGSRRALAWAVEDAALQGAVVEAVTVCRGGGDDMAERYVPFITSHPMNRPIHPKVEEARQRLAATVAQMAEAYPGVEMTRQVLQGEDPGEALCRRAERADLLVVGSRGRGAFPSRLLGSVSSRCAHHSPCTVVIVPEGPSGAPRHPPVRNGRIVVGVDMSDGSRHALEWAIGEAAARGDVVRAVTVWGRTYSYGADVYSPSDDEVGFRAKRALDALVREVAGGAPAVAIETLADEGDPGARLCALARDADLLVVGHRGHNALASLLLGSVAGACAHHSPVPVAIVRPRPAVSSPH
ncbi:MAG: universal stress protein [Actinomycetota bacterium]|nr:universal stress protein [Actinomycetota bacterium]